MRVILTAQNCPIHRHTGTYIDMYVCMYVCPCSVILDSQRSPRIAHVCFQVRTSIVSEIVTG